MTVREYVGARYVPLFIGEWDETADYEPLSVVTYQGASYTSRQSVPAGTAISNEAYWAVSGNYNAQIEAYREEVFAFDGRIDDLEDKFPISTSDIADGAITAAKINDGSITTAKIANEAITREKISPDVLDDDKPYFVICGDSFCVNTRTVVSNLAALLGKTAINMAAGGASFTGGTGSTSIIDQFDSACDDAHFSDAAFIIIYGGINDFSTNNPATLSSMSNALTAILTKYNSLVGYKPELYLCIGNAPYSAIGWVENYPNWVNECNKIAQRMNFPNVVENVYCWLLGLGNTAVFDQDLLHPNSTGCHYIAQMLYKVVTGTYSGVSRVIRFPHVCDSGYITCAITNDIVNYTYFLDLTNDQIATQQTSEWQRVSTDVSAGVAFINVGTKAVDQLMVNGNASAMAIDTSGHIAIQTGAVNMAYSNLYLHSRGQRELMTYSYLQGSVTFNVAPFCTPIPA